MQERNHESAGGIVVYSKPGTCVQCVAVKRWLAANNVPFEERNALDHMELLASTGIKSMPIVDLGNGEFFGGFDIGKLARAKEKTA